MGKVAVHYKMTAQPGKGDEVASIVESLYEGSLDAEPGTLLHVMHRAKDNPDVIVFYELYADDDALKAHSQGEVLKALGPKLSGLLAGRPDFVLLDAVNAKGIDV